MGKQNVSIYRLHELASPKGHYVRLREFKPLSVFSLVCKAQMPVPLDPTWIVCADSVNCFALLRQLNGEFTFASTK